MDHARRPRGIVGHSIVCRFDQKARQWVAWFGHTPHIGFGSSLPMGAVRRLLEGSEVAQGSCDADQCGTSVLHRELTWQPPEMLLPCAACGGTGQHAGLTEVWVRQVCGGRKMLPV